MTLAAVYLRISQDRDGTLLGVDRQREDCEAHAATLGWTVAHTLIDDDLSAFSGKRRPAYEALLGLIGSGEIGAVIAWHPDRLHRSPRELERFIDLVQASGCKVATVKAGELDLSTASGRMTARVVGAVARHESEQKSERLRRQRAQAALAGRPHGGPRPFGWQADRLTLDSKEATAIREAAARVLAGASVRSVATDWNARGILPVRGGEWWPSNVKDLLTNPRLAGLRVHLGEIVAEGQWEPVLPRAEWEQLQAVLTITARRGRHPASLLGGLLVCGRCGGLLTHDTPKGARRYVCVPNPGKRHGCRLSITAPPVEAHLVAVVLAAADQPIMPPEPAPAPDLGRLEDRRAMLAEMFAAGQISQAEWLRARDRIERDLADAHHAQVVDLQAVRRGKVGVSLADRWDTLGPDERRAVLAVFVQQVNVAPGTARTPVDRLTIRWAV